MNTEPRKILPDDVKEEIREMAKEGLTPWNIAYYEGVGIYQVLKILDPAAIQRHREACDRWRSRNPEKVKISQKKATRKYWIRHRDEILAKGKKQNYTRVIKLFVS